MAHKISVKKRVKIRFQRKLYLLGGAFLVLFLIVLGCYLWIPQRQFATEGVELYQVFSIPVIRQYIPEDHPNRPGIHREIHYLVIHETANYAPTATAKNHAEYLCTTTDINSWHYTVDEKEIYHHLPDEEVGWHAGDQKTENGGNMTGIGIELCVNEGSDFQQTVDHAAQLAAVLLQEYGLRLSEIKKHQDFSGKNCPEHLLEPKAWNDFLALVKQYQKQLKKNG